MSQFKKNNQSNGYRIDNLTRGETITFFVNGFPTQAHLGETIHAALIAAGYQQFRKSKTGKPRGVFCGMGVCFECLVTVNGRTAQQACTISVEQGMEVEIEIS